MRWVKYDMEHVTVQVKASLRELNFLIIILEQVSQVWTHQTAENK